MRARILDDFDGEAAHRFYRYAPRTHPERGQALEAHATSGLIHGTLWRPAAVAILTGLAALPVRWRWPHRYLLIYDTFNAPPARRWRNARRVLEVDPNELDFLARGASAAKEVDPRTSGSCGATWTGKAGTSPSSSCATVAAPAQRPAEGGTGAA